MNDILTFIVGMIAGSSFGVLIMCIMQINRCIDIKDNNIKKTI